MKDTEFYIKAIVSLLQKCDKDTIEAIYKAISNMVKKR